MKLYEISEDDYTVTLDPIPKTNTFVYGEDEKKAIIKFLESYNGEIYGLRVKFVCEEKDIIK